MLQDRSGVPASRAQPREEVVFPIKASRRLTAVLHCGSQIPTLISVAPMTLATTHLGARGGCYSKDVLTVRNRGNSDGLGVSAFSRIVGAGFNVHFVLCTTVETTDGACHNSAGCCGDAAHKSRTRRRDAHQVVSHVGVAVARTDLNSHLRGGDGDHSDAVRF